MDLDSFRASLSDRAPPAGLSAPLRALWLAAGDRWDEAHGIVGEDESADAAWVHAYLHRVEGDESNAGYWYRRAGKPHCKRSLASEWAEIVDTMLRGA